MKRLLTYVLVALFTLAFSNSALLEVKALENNAYKTVTNRNIIYVVENDGTFSHSWKFNKQLYKDNIDFSLNLLKTSPNLNNIEKNIDNDVNRQYLFFEHHGSLPTEASIKVGVDDDFKEGESLYLYYFNDITNKLEYVDNNIVVKNGMVEFEIEHCSDYILTASIVKSAIDNPQGMTMIIVTLIVVGVILVAATLFLNKK